MSPGRVKKNRDKLHILVVDDHPDSREMAVEYLRSLGYETLSIAETEPTLWLCLRRMPRWI